MRLIDADKAKAELLAIDETIPAQPGFFDGLKTGYQSAADRLDTMSVVEERKHGQMNNWGMNVMFLIYSFTMQQKPL